MKIAATSDLHGHLPKIPECDILCIAGDICPVWNHDLTYQFEWLRREFHEWLKEIPAKHVCATWGNHDWIAEKMPDMIPKVRCTFLMDELVEVEGLKIYGSPWQKRFFDWAFNLDEPELCEVFNKIPPCDILITHSPPLGIGDWSFREYTGSPMLLRKIEDLQPKLHVFGHIHKGYGRYKINNTISANVSLVNEKYTPTNPVMEFEI